MKKIGIFIVLILLSLFLISFNKYEYTNGDDDYSFEHITDEAIISGGKCMEVGATEVTLNGITTRTAKSANGVRVLETLDGNKTYKINLKVNAIRGNVKVVLVCEEKIVYEFKINEDNSYIYHLGGSSITSLKIACESLEYEIIYSIKEL